jgi:hypothetical protein
VDPNREYPRKVRKKDPWRSKDKVEGEEEKGS